MDKYEEYGIVDNYLEGSIKIAEPLKYAGSWNIGDTGNEMGYIRIMLKKKPIWFHRIMMKLLLGIWWVDNKN